MSAKPLDLKNAIQVDRNKTHTEGEYQYFWLLRDYLEQLEDKEALRRFQERHYGYARILRAVGIVDGLE